MRLCVRVRQVRLCEIPIGAREFSRWRERIACQAGSVVRERSIEFSVDDIEVIRDGGSQAMDSGDRAKANGGRDQRVLDHVLTGFIHPQVSDKARDKRRAWDICRR
jgi:hypothetical protein